MKKWFATTAFLLLLSACGGVDVTPVYFKGGTDAAKEPEPSESKPAQEPSARCNLSLTAKLCVKIKGKNIEVGTDEPLCADTPPIPLEIEGSRIILKGSEFPDIPVSVKVKGVDTPMTINGRGTGDGADNVGEGTWTPEGEIAIEDFAFYVNVLGVTGKIPGLDLTTGEAAKTPDLPPLKGSPSDESGKTTLVAATVLGSLFEAADKFLLGASMQAIFEGTLSPPLAECESEGQSQTSPLQVVKLLLTPEGKLLEEPLPGGNVLEVSSGTFIAQGPQDVGPSFETTAHFKMTNTGDESIEILLPVRAGPFLISAEGSQKRNLKPKGSISFEVTFRPAREETTKAGTLKQGVRFGNDPFYLVGVALDPGGKGRISRMDDQGGLAEANIETLNLAPLFVPATTVKKYFLCREISCNGQKALTECRTCRPQETSGCALQAVNSGGKPVQEADTQCRPLYPDSLPVMGLELAGAPNTAMAPSKQSVVIQNSGVKPLVIEKIFLEEVENSQSRGQFLISGYTLLVGTSAEKAQPQSFPVKLPPYQKGLEETSAFLHITYLPTDLKGYDGKQAAPGLSVWDKARLKVVTREGTRVLELVGQTRIQEVPELQAWFATATGFKPKANLETFSMEEVTAETTDLSVPVFLQLADTASAGLRVTEIKVTGKDAPFFEWLNTPVQIASRQPAAGKGKRCSIPVFDPSTGNQIEEIFDLNFATLGSGFDLKPGAFTKATMPLFGCLNFHRNPEEPPQQRLFEAMLVVTALKLDPEGKPERNPDHTTKQTQLTVRLAAAIEPLKGKFVLRITQTLAAILNPTSPSLAAMPAEIEVERMLKEGKGTRKELGVLLGALILDPFDEMEITDARGQVASTPGDGVTAVFREQDTRPSAVNYPEEHLSDYTSLLHDSDLPEKGEGIFYDYGSEERPLPDPLKVSGWRIFTGALSYPGPLHPRSPINMAECDVIDPCSSEGLAKFTESGATGGRGACAFFYTSGARYHSPAYEPLIQNRPVDLCETRDRGPELLSANNGRYSVDGALTFEDLGMRFWGPNYFLNPAGPLGFKPPMDELFHVAFTTELLKPKAGPQDPELIPDEKIDISRLEHKVNLTQTDLSNPPMCPSNTKNRTLGGREYSSWHYFAPLWFKDEAGEIPAGCPEEGNDFKGGTAFLRGRKLDPETGVFTIVMAAKFGSREELSLAFKNVVIFVALNAWACDPQGDEENFEGAKCFDTNFNKRDAKAQISYIPEEEP